MERGIRATCKKLQVKSGEVAVRAALDELQVHLQKIASKAVVRRTTVHTGTHVYPHVDGSGTHTPTRPFRGVGRVYQKSCVPPAKNYNLQNFAGCMFELTKPAKNRKLQKIATTGGEQRVPLTDAEVDLIRELHEEFEKGHPQHLGHRRLAKMFGVSRSSISNYCHYRKRRP